MSNVKKKNPRGVFEKISGSGIWWIRYYDADGQKHRERVGGKGAAINLYRKRKTEIMEGKKLPHSLRVRPVTFSELADAALEYSERNKKSYRTDKNRMKPLKGHFGSRTAESIKPQDIERFMSDVVGGSGATQNRFRALISLTYRLGIANGKVTVNPARLVRPKRESRGRIRFLSDEEEQTLRGVIQEKYPHHLPELELALNTGMRLGEQYRLTWDAVAFGRRTVELIDTKNGENRHVDLNDVAMAALQTAHKLSNGKPHVFLNRYGDRLVGPREWFDPAVKDAGLRNFTWHCLRHTFASRMIKTGVNIRELQELLGHKTIQMTMRYSHLAPSDKLAAVQRLCDTTESQKGTAQSEATDPPTDPSVKSGTSGVSVKYN